MKKNFLREDGFVQIPNKLLQEVVVGCLQPTDIVAYLMLKADYPSCTLGDIELGKLLNRSESTGQRCVDKLKERKHIVRKIIQGGSEVTFLTYAQDGKIFYRGNIVTGKELFKPERKVEMVPADSPREDEEKEDAPF